MKSVHFSVTLTDSSEKKKSLKVCDTIKWRVVESEEVSKERYCFRCCLVKQRTVCTINVGLIRKSCRRIIVQKPSQRFILVQ